jgi:hypothetical protein
VGTSATASTASAAIQSLSNAQLLAGSAASFSAASAILTQTAAGAHLLTGTAASSSSASAVIGAGIIVYGTVTLTDQQVTTITLTDQQVTTITLTITDEEGVAMNSFILGNVVRLNALIKDINLALTDAATITVSTKPAGGVATPVTPARLSAGTYRYDYKPAASGTYAVRVETLNPDAATEEQFYILPSQFP